MENQSRLSLGQSLGLIVLLPLLLLVPASNESGAILKHLVSQILAKKEVYNTWAKFHSFQMTPVEAPRSTDSFLFFDCRDAVFFFILTWLVVALGAVNDFAPSPGVRSHNGIPTASQQQQSAANRSITATGHHWSPLGTSRHILRILRSWRSKAPKGPTCCCCCLCSCSRSSACMIRCCSSHFVTFVT